MMVRNARPRVIAISSSLWHGLGKSLGLIGVCVYMIGFVLPLTWDTPITLLSVFSALTLITKSKQTSRLCPPLTVTILLFIASIGLSTLFSEDIGRSIRLSASLVPALILFLLIAQHFDGVRDIQSLFLTLSAVSFGVATALLLTSWHEYHGWGLKLILKNLGIPVLLVPNDLTFLAVIAPLSLALFYHKPRSASGILALISVLLSMGAVCAFRSRTAALTMIITVTCAVILMRPRQRWVRGVMRGFGFLLLLLFIDGLLSFPLAAKVVRKVTMLGRMSYWSTSWSMFLEAPLLGKGPYTFGLFHKTPWVHNLYLEALAEQGIIGLGALVGLLVSGISMTWRVYCRAVGEVQVFSASVFAALIGFCSAGVFELTLLRKWVVITLFILVGVVAQLSISQEQTKERR